MESIKRDVACDCIFFGGCGRRCTDWDMGTIVWPLSPSVFTATVKGSQVCSPHLRDEESKRYGHLPRLTGLEADGAGCACRAARSAPRPGDGHAVLSGRPHDGTRACATETAALLLRGSTPCVCPLGVVRGSVVTPCTSPVPG